MQTKIRFISVLKLAAAVVILLTVFNPPSQAGVRAATIWHVPADYATLQAALDAAAAGDTVLVAPGTYVENIDFKGKDVSLLSEGGAERTFLHHAPGTQTVTVTMGPGGTIQGFDVLDGDDDNMYALIVNGAGSIIRNNIFENNQFYNGQNGIINLTNGSPTVIGNIFRKNCPNYGTAVVTAGYNTKIVNNLFVNNDCIAVKLIVSNDYAPQVINNTFVGNRIAVYNSGLYPEDHHIFRNNLIYKNYSGISTYNVYYPYTPTWENNLVYGNTYNFDLYYPDPTGTNGNISVDPLITADSTPPYRLQPGSPAIDAGSSDMCPAQDFRGIPRPQASGCDIGAYEFSQFAFTQPDFPVREESGTALVSVALNTSLAAEASIQYATRYDGKPWEATPGIDYTPVSGMLTFPAGVRQASFSIPISDDDLIEDAESISVVISDATGLLDAATVTIFKSDRFSVYVPLCLKGCSDFFDDFSNPASGWNVTEDSQVKSAYVDGEFEVDSKYQGSSLFLSPACSRENYIVEMDVHWMQNRGDYYGMIFGMHGNFDSYYMFEVHAVQQRFYLFSHVNNGPFNELIANKKSSFIHTGKQVNHLKVTRSGSSIILYINGQKVGRADDNQITGLTQVGLFSYGGYNGNSQARFDNFKVTTIWKSAEATGDFTSPLDGTFSIPDPALSVDQGGDAVPYP